MFFVEGLMIPAKECSERFGINYKTLMSYYYSRGRDATEERLNNISKHLRDDNHRDTPTSGKAQTWVAGDEDTGGVRKNSLERIPGNEVQPFSCCE